MSAGDEAEVLLFVGTDIHRPVDDARVAVNIHSSHLTAGKILARVDGWRTSIDVQIATRWIHEQRVKPDETGRIVAGRALIRSECGVVDVVPDPRAVRTAADRKEEVAVDHVAGHYGAPIVDEQPAIVRKDNVVLDNVVACVELDVDLAAPIALGEVVVERVVDNHAVFRAAAAFVVSAKGNARLGIVVEEVVAERDETGVPARVFAAQFNAQIGIMYDVALNDDPRAAVHVDAACAALVAIGRIAKRVYVIHEITDNSAIAGAVKGRVGILAFEADKVDTDVVVIMHDVIRDREEFHVAVQYHRFAPAKLAVIDFVAIDDEVVYGGVRVATIGGNAMCTAVVTTVFDIMHLVVADFNERAVATDRDSLRERRGNSTSLEVADFESDQLDVLFVHNTDQSHFPADGKACAVNDGRAARVILQDDVITGRS